MVHNIENAQVLIVGGTGSLGQKLFKRLLSSELGNPESIVIFSRDEAKQHYMRLAFSDFVNATDDILYRNIFGRVRFVIGDVRNYADVKKAVDRANVIFHAAALKQVPSCEYYAPAAIDTNVYGAINICRAVAEGSRTTKHIVGISTDKACKPVNVMGMTKALQERIFIQANIDSPWARFVNVRYGNVMASRGSAIPFFLELIAKKQPVPITHQDMTRYLMTLDQSVDLVFSAFRKAHLGETFIPIVPSAKVTNMVYAIAENKDYPMVDTQIRPGEKIHEILISEEEVSRCEMRDGQLVILPILPELRTQTRSEAPLPFTGEYSSSQNNVSVPVLTEMLKKHKLTTTTFGSDSFLDP